MRRMSSAMNARSDSDCLYSCTRLVRRISNAPSWRQHLYKFHAWVVLHSQERPYAAEWISKGSSCCRALRQRCHWRSRKLKSLDPVCFLSIYFLSPLLKLVRLFLWSERQVIGGHSGEESEANIDFSLGLWSSKTTHLAPTIFSSFSKLVELLCVHCCCC